MASNHSFTVGRQPCGDFKPGRECNEHATWDNRHECFGPFDGRPRGCDLEVSWCDTCSKDHHENGYEACGTRRPKEDDDA